MAPTDVHQVLLRALFESEFLILLTSNPEKALTDYSLTEEEKNALTSPSQDIYRFLNSSQQSSHLLSSGNQPPTTTTTVSTIIVVAIVVTALAISPQSKDPEELMTNIERFKPIINQIKSSRGTARYNLVRALINELTKEL